MFIKMPRQDSTSGFLRRYLAVSVFLERRSVFEFGLALPSPLQGHSGPYYSRGAPTIRQGMGGSSAPVSS